MFCFSRFQCFLVPKPTLLIRHIIIKDILILQDATVGRTLDQQEEIVSMITMLPVDSSDEDFDAVPTSCLTKWLNNPDNDFTIDNLKRTCEHGKLRPSDVHEVKYINSEIVSSLEH